MWNDKKKTRKKPIVCDASMSVAYNRTSTAPCSGSFVHKGSLWIWKIAGSLLATWGLHFHSEVLDCFQVCRLTRPLQLVLDCCPPGRAICVASWWLELPSTRLHSSPVQILAVQPERNNMLLQTPGASLLHLVSWWFFFSSFKNKKKRKFKTTFGFVC